MQQGHAEPRQGHCNLGPIPLAKEGYAGPCRKRARICLLREVPVLFVLTTICSPDDCTAIAEPGQDLFIV